MRISWATQPNEKHIPIDFYPHLFIRILVGTLLALTAACGQSKPAGPEIDNVSPIRIAEGTAIPITIEGKHFYPLVDRNVNRDPEFTAGRGFYVYLSSEDNPEGEATSLSQVLYVDTTSVLAMVPDEMPAGKYDVTLIIPDGRSAPAPKPIIIEGRGAGSDEDSDSSPETETPSDDVPSDTDTQDTDTQDTDQESDTQDTGDTETDSEIATDTGIGGDTEVLYREIFPNASGARQENFNGSGWYVNRGTTGTRVQGTTQNSVIVANDEGKPADAPPVNSGNASGEIALGIGDEYDPNYTGRELFWTEEHTVGAAVWFPREIRWHMANGSSQDTVHAVVRIDGTWYVTDRGVTTSFPIDTFRNFNLDAEEEVVDIWAAEWRRLGFTEGVELSVQELQELPQGDLTAFGLYAASSMDNIRFDTYEIIGTAQ